MTRPKTRSQKRDFAQAAIQASLELAQRPILTSKFGPSSAVLLHFIVREFPAIPVVWVDTGYNTPDTHEFVTQLKSMFDLNLHIYRPAEPWANGVPGPDDAAFARFVEHIKLQPFSRALADLNPDVWFSALRHEQTHYRGSLGHFQRTSHELLKVSPVLEWTKADMEAYRLGHHLPTVGEAQDPAKPALHLECGLHPRFS